VKTPINVHIALRQTFAEIKMLFPVGEIVVSRFRRERRIENVESRILSTRCETTIYY